VDVSNVGTDEAVVVDGRPYEAAPDGTCDVGRFGGGDSAIEPGEEDVLVIEVSARSRAVEIKLATARGGEYGTYVFLP